MTSFPAHIQFSLLNPLLIYPSFLVSNSQAMPRCLSSPTFPFHLPVILQETSCCHNVALSTQLCFRPALGSDQRASSSSSGGLPRRVAAGAREEPWEQGWAGTRSLPAWWHERAPQRSTLPIDPVEGSCLEEQPFSQSLVSLGRLSQEQT